MEKYSFESNKTKLLFIVTVMFAICVFCLKILLFQNPNETNAIQTFINLLLIPFTIWYVILFFSILKEKFSGIEFDNTEKKVLLYSSGNGTLTIPFDNIKLINFQVGQCIRFVSYTKIGIYTNDNKYYKITILKTIAKGMELYNKLSSQLNTKYGYTFLLMP